MTLLYRVNKIFSTMKALKTTKEGHDEGILFLPSNILVPASPEESILEVALRHKVLLNHSCGGMGTCTTRRVFVEKGLEKLGERTELEAERAEERFFSESERLSCQNAAVSGLVLRVP